MNTARVRKFTIPFHDTVFFMATVEAGSLEEAQRMVFEGRVKEEDIKEVGRTGENQILSEDMFFLNRDHDEVEA